MSYTYKFKAAFTKLGVRTAPSSAPVCTVVDSSNNVLANAQAATALAAIPGLYLYSYTGDAGLDLIAIFRTSDPSMDQQDLLSYTPDIILTNLDAAISGRAAPGSAIDLVDALKHKVESSGYDRTTDSLEALGEKESTSPAAIDTQLSGVHGSGRWGAGIGGLLSIFDTITNSITHAIVPGVTVRLFSDANRTVQIDHTTTDAFGAYEFRDLVAGTYYLRAEKPGEFDPVEYVKVAV
jgi:hypothetical protein